MSFITFQCYACSKSLKVPADKAGKKAKCNQCGTVLTIPAQSSVAETPAAPPAPPPAPSQPPPEQAFEPAYADYVPQPGPAAYPPQPGGYPPPPGGYTPGALVGAEQFSLDEEYAPEQAVGSPGAPKWNLVRLGFLLIFIGSCVLGGSFALNIIGWLLFTIPTIQVLSGSFLGGDSGSVWHVLLAVGTLLSLGGTITAVVGYVLCMLGANVNNSFGLCIAAIAVAGVEALLIMIFQLPNLFGSGIYGVTGFGQSFFLFWFMLLLIQLLFGAEIILFCLVARAIALALKKKQTAKASTVPLIWAGAYSGERLLTFVFWYIMVSVGFMGTGGRVMGWITMLLLWAGIGVYIAFIIMYSLFLWRMRKLIPEQ